MNYSEKMTIFEGQFVSFPYSGEHQLQEMLRELGIIVEIFDDGLTVESVGKYIVCIRGFELAVEDWYSRGELAGLLNTDFETFREQHVANYDRFMSTWVSSNNIPNRLTLTYNDITTDTVQTLIRVYHFITDQHPDDQMIERIKKVGFYPIKRAQTTLSLLSNARDID